MTAPVRPKLTEFATIGLVSGSMLTHEILLTRICALRLQFHFAFLVISNCLLALGAAGTVLSIGQARFTAEPRKWTGRFTLAYVASLVVTYWLLLAIPLPENVQLSRFDHVLSLCAFNLIGAVPFFFTGLVIGLLLSVHAKHADRLYAVDLLCAGLGCVACPLLLPILGAGGVFVVVALVAVAGAMFSAREELGKPILIGGAVIVVLGLAIAPKLDTWVPVPSKPSIDPARQTKPDGVHSVWTANSRIDLTFRPGCSAPLFMMGANQHERPRECLEIAQDATAATTISNFTGEPQALEILRGSMYSTAYRLKQSPEVFIIGLGGGNDAWAAKANGARRIKAIELNWPIVDIHRRVKKSWSRDLVEDPNVQIVVDEGRSALMRESAFYDVVQMTGIDTWTALASGAYVLAENYLYTPEAIASMYARLKPDGIIQISRFGLAMETLRLLSNIHAALAKFGVTDLRNSLVIQSTPDFMLSIQIKKGTFTEAEQQSVSDFAATSGIAVLYLPNRAQDDIISQFIRTDDRQAIIDSFPENISPTNDDQPYFFNFTRWQSPSNWFERMHDVPAISQGNPVFVLTQLAVSILLSVALIVWPLKRRSGLPSAGSGKVFAFFAALGVGFISIEIAVIQKTTLLLGQPVFSLTVTLFSLLIFTGMGSLAFARFVRIGTRSAVLVPILIVAYVAAINVLSPVMVKSLIASALPVRILACAALLAPLGLLLGIPFAYGLRTIGEHAPELTPWAWAINGCTSVVGSILTVVLSMNFGFSAVLWIASLLYVAGFAALNRLPRAT